MIGRQFKKKTTDENGTAGELWHITADDNGGRWIITPVSFGPNLAFTAAELRRHFVRTADVEAPEDPTYDAETEGWKRLSAEQRFATIAAAAEAGDIQTGDALTVPGFDGEPVDATEPLTKQEVGRLRAAARKLRGPNAPTPEQVFESAHTDAQRDEIQAAADKIIGNAEALASYEIGALQAAPAVERIIDAHVRRRNREDDRQTYPNAHVFERGGRRER